MIDVSEVVSDPDFQTPLHITRTAPGTTNDDGVFIPGLPQDFDIMACTQPAKPADMIAQYPEGERQVNAIKIYSPVPILMADGNGQQSDILIWQGQPYRVDKSMPWGVSGYWFVMASGFVPAPEGA